MLSKPGETKREGSGAEGNDPKPRSRRPTRRKLFWMKNRVKTNSSGFVLTNYDQIFGDVPPKVHWSTYLFKRGFDHLPVRPIIVVDPKAGRVHWDMEEALGYWLISDRMKSVIEVADPEAFAFLEC